jgi:hypothetical protein
MELSEEKVGFKLGADEGSDAQVGFEEGVENLCS